MTVWPRKQPPADALPGLPGVESRIQALETALEALQGRLASLVQDRASDAVTGHDTRSLCDAHETRLEELTFAVAHGINHVERTENRIRATVRRAQEQLEDGGVSSPGLDAEAAELRLVHDEGGGAEQVPTVPSGVAAPDVSDIPGDWTPEDLALLGGAG